MARTRSNNSKDSTANLGFEAKLWLASDNFYFRLSTFKFLITPHLAPHDMAGFVLRNGT